MWKPASTVTGQIVTAKSLNNSVNGNPRYDIVFLIPNRFGSGQDHYETFTTSSDSACSYDVENVMANWRREAATVTLGLTRAGRVATITKV